MKSRLGVVLVVLASILLIATTFGDWYVVTATHSGSDVFRLIPRADGDTLVRMAQSPWEHDKPRAIAIIAAALTALVAAVLGHVEKLKEQTASLVVGLSAVLAVGVFITRLASHRSAQAFTVTVHIDFLTGFYLAAGCAAALLVAAAVHLASTSLRASASS